MIPGAPIEVVLTQLSTEARVGHDGVESSPSDRSWSSPGGRRCRDRRAPRCPPLRVACDATANDRLRPTAKPVTHPYAPPGDDPAALRFATRTPAANARRPLRDVCREPVSDSFVSECSSTWCRVLLGASSSPDVQHQTFKPIQRTLRRQRRVRVDTQPLSSRADRSLGKQMGRHR